MKTKIFASFLIALILAFSAVKGAPTGASVQAGQQERGSEGSAGNVPTEGGNITRVNLTAYQITGKWAGFWGNVSGDIRLADSSGNIFYKWTISDATGGVVYACNGTVSDWSSTNIQPIYSTDPLLPSFLKEGTDSFNLTFTSQETFTSPSLSIPNTNYTTTYQNNAPGSDFKTYALKTASGDVLIWAGKVKENMGSFKGSTVTADYQILAGVTSTTGTTTFYFYLELP
jgi:hypothetical protein